MKIVKIILIILAILLILMTILFFYFVYTPRPQKPKLSAEVQQATINIDNIDRSYTFFVPENLTKKPALLFVLHGTIQDADSIRRFSGYEFDRLADSKKFIVVYPEGFGRNWNACRKASTHSAKKNNINDKSFILALIDLFKKNYNIDPSRIFIAGFSNGAHMAYRFAFELRSKITAIAAIAGSIPTLDNMDCIELQKPLPVLIMNGTKDPMNPYEGGIVSNYGFSSRGTVRSSMGTARYFANLAGYDDNPTETATLPHLNQSDPTSVRRDIWRAGGKPEIILYTIIGGGHLVPQQNYIAPRMFGKTTYDINGPVEIWNFFSRQVSEKQVNLKID